jgi:hypothetical protein
MTEHYLMWKIDGIAPIHLIKVEDNKNEKGCKVTIIATRSDREWEASTFDGPLTDKVFIKDYKLKWVEREIDVWDILPLPDEVLKRIEMLITAREV